MQLRDKGMEAAEELDHLQVFADACAPARQAPRGQRPGGRRPRGRVPTYCTSARATCPSRRPARSSARTCSIGRSTHAESEAAAAAVQEGVDYFCTGPCWPTPTKPGRHAPGLDLVRYTAALATERPWFAIGGIDLGNLDEVLAAGARRVVVVRAITEADDPGAAAAEFAKRLRAL